MWFSLKLGFRAFLEISRKNWDFRQNIWISGARGHLKSPQKRPEIHKNARNPNIWKTKWEGPRCRQIGFFYKMPNRIVLVTRPMYAGAAQVDAPRPSTRKRPIVIGLRHDRR